MLNNNRKVLVTGAAGKQGGSVVRHMRRQGWNVCRSGKGDYS